MSSSLEVLHPAVLYRAGWYRGSSRVLLRLSAKIQPAMHRTGFKHCSYVYGDVVSGEILLYPYPREGSTLAGRLDYTPTRRGPHRQVYTVPRIRLYDVFLSRLAVEMPELIMMLSSSGRVELQAYVDEDSRVLHVRVA